MSKNIKWYIHWFQTSIEYQNKGFGTILIEYIKRNIKNPILLLSLHKAKRFWISIIGAKILSDDECLYEYVKYYCLLNTSDYTTYEKLSLLFIHGETLENIKSRWNLSLYISGDGDLTSDLEYLIDDIETFKLYLKGLPLKELNDEEIRKIIFYIFLIYIDQK